MIYKSQTGIDGTLLAFQHSVCAVHAVGQVMSAAIGAAFRLALKDAIWLAAPLALSCSLLAMQLTRTVHPPGKKGNKNSVLGVHDKQLEDTCFNMFAFLCHKAAHDATDLISATTHLVRASVLRSVCICL